MPGLGMESGMAWTMKRLQRLNQRNINRNVVICCVCDEFVGKEFFLVGPRKRGCCINCAFVGKLPDYTSIQVSDNIIDQYKDLVYPCLGHCECHFTGTYDEAIEHARHCDPDFVCKFCQSFVDYDSTTDHFLKFHCNNKLFASHEAVFDKIVLKLPIETHLIHILRSGYTDFILFIKKRTDHKLDLVIVKSIGFLGRKFNRVSHDTFVVEYTDPKTKARRKSFGRTVSIREYLDDAAVPVKIVANNNQKMRLPMRIHFNNLERLKNASVERDECPICLEALTMKTLKCKYGHSVCANCEKKITTCPFCREPMNIALGSDEKLREVSVQCKNKHCLAVVGDISCSTHSAASCPMQVLECAECARSYPRCKMLEHLQANHNQFFQAYEFYVQRTEGTRVYYFLYRDRLFRLSFSVVGKDRTAAQRLNVRVQLMFDSGATDFHYELHFYRNPERVMAKNVVRGVVQSQNEEGYSRSLVVREEVPQIAFQKTNALDYMGFFRIYFFRVDERAQLSDLLNARLTL